MRLMVTGGAGYIGSVVTEQLLDEGHSVTVFDNLSKGHRSAVVAGAEFVQGNISDSAQVRQTLDAGRIEAVIHMAADSLVGESAFNPSKYFRNNLVGSL